MTDVIDFSQAKLAATEAGEEDTKVEWTGSVKIGKREYPIRQKLPIAATIEIDEAQQSGDAARIIKSLTQVLRKEAQADALEYLTADPDDDDDVVSIEDLVEAVSNAQEQMAARPKGK